jgi:flagellar biosynthesis protein FlhF
MSASGATKTYRAKSIAVALATIREELGPDAVIVSTRQIQAGGLLGLGRSGVEVRATRAPVVSKAPARPKPSQPNRQKLTSEIGQLRETITRMREEVRAARVETVQQRDNADAIAARLSTEVESASSVLRGVLAEAFLARRTGLPDAQVEVIQQLVTNGVEPGIAEATVRAAYQDSNEAPVVRRAVAEFLLAQIKTSRPLEASVGRRVVAFVGPTGVGKTTTIAKVAAACIIAGRQVGLVSTDTYRIAAVEQLKCYADLMGLHLAVANTPAEVRGAVEACKRCHVVLIDTAGRSHRAAAEIARLGAMLSRAWVDQVHLVLPAQMGHQDIRSTYQSFSQLGVDGIDWTKLDEALRFGALFNGQLISGRPAGYLSAGQRVPEDLEAATPERMTRLILTDTSRRVSAPARVGVERMSGELQQGRREAAVCAAIGM